VNLGFLDGLAPYWWWLTAGVALGILELLAPGFFLVIDDRPRRDRGNDAWGAHSVASDTGDVTSYSPSTRSTRLFEPAQS